MLFFFPISHLRKKQGEKTDTMNYGESFFLATQNEIWAHRRVGKLNKQATLGLELSSILHKKTYV